MAGTNVGPVNQAIGQSGGMYAWINVTAAQVIKGSSGILVRVLVVSAGTTSGNLTINDCATTGAATAANTIFTALFSSLTVGEVIFLDWPCGTGIVVSAVPSAGSPQFSLSYS